MLSGDLCSQLFKNTKVCGSKIFLYQNLVTQNPQCYRKFCSPPNFMLKKHRETNKLLQIFMTRAWPKGYQKEFQECNKENLFLYMVLDNIQFHSFISSCPLLPAMLNEETVFSPLYSLASFVKDKETIGVCVYLWAFSPIPLIYMSGHLCSHIHGSSN